MSYSEIYTRRNWVNEPDTSTPLDADNLNAMDLALKTIDTRVCTIGNDAMYAADVANALYGQPTIDQETGVITFPKKDGGAYTLDTMLEKVVVNFDWDPITETLTITLEDGTTKQVNLSALIQENEFDDTETIDFTVSGHHVSAIVKAHSIGEDQLVTSYLTDCQTAKAGAEQAEENAEAWAVGQRDGTDVPSTDPTYQNNSKHYADEAGQHNSDSEAWAVGQRAGTDVPSTDPTHNNNSKYYAAQAENAVDNINTALNMVQFSINTTTGELEYDDDISYTFTINETTGNLEWEVNAA